MVLFDNQQPTTQRENQSPGSGKRHCDPWPDPKTAVADLPRARSSPEGIFPTADASAPTPTNQQPTTNNQQLTTNNQQLTTNN
ncbi:MAG: hypothetical protein ACHBN1_23105 [Heteroscytonema crispum UTEX LB 1556]